jgi:hypothetical protein
MLSISFLLIRFFSYFIRFMSGSVYPGTGIMAHACNPSYSESEDGMIKVQSQPGKKFMRPLPTTS